MNKDQTPMDGLAEWLRASAAMASTEYMLERLSRWASEVEAARAQTAAEPPEPQWKDLDYSASPSFPAPAPTVHYVAEFAMDGTPLNEAAHKVLQLRASAAPAPGAEEGTGGRVRPCGLAQCPEVECCKSPDCQNLPSLKRIAGSEGQKR